jgi:hypothetical protein
MLVAITYGQFASSSPSAIVELGSTLEFAIVEASSLLSLKVFWVHLQEQVWVSYLGTISGFFVGGTRQPSAGCTFGVSLVK